MTDRVPLDPDLMRIVAVSRARQEPSPFDEPPAQARARMERAAADKMPATGIAGWEDRIAEEGARAVPVRIYRPRAPSGVTALFFHGGGFVVGSVASADDISRRLCRGTGAVIVAVDYRLAPEHPFPAAHDDALAAAIWTHRAIAELGGNRRRLAVIGESAGANLAASTALGFRDMGLPLAAQLLVAPGLDLARDVDALDALDRDFPLLGPDDLRAITRLYMGSRIGEAGRFPPSPAHAERLDGVAPALVAVAGHDALEGEGLAYARRLAQAGVRVETIRLPDMFHPFLGFAGQSAGAGRAMRTICDRFCALVGGNPDQRSESWKETI